MRTLIRGLLGSLSLCSLVGVGACGSSGGPSSNALLAALTLSSGSLAPAFDAAVTMYAVGPALLPGSVILTPTTAAPSASVTVNGVATPSGTPSAPVTLPPGPTVVAVVVTAEDGVTQITYTLVFQRNPGGQEAYVKASNTETNDTFSGGQLGFDTASIAIDGNTLVVGAPEEDSNATGVNGNQADNTALSSGAAYVFVRTGALWTQQAYLKASNTEASDRFGFGVAISGDTIVVGAPTEDSNATGVNGNEADNTASASGAAYVFVRTLGSWSQQAYLKASNTGASDQCGLTVGVSGNTIVVGADLEDSNATGVNGNEADNTASNSGAAYVFVRNGLVWTQQAYLKASNSEANDNFGRIVAIANDTIAVGASGEDSNATGVNGNEADNSAASSGAAYVFVRSGLVWTQQAYLKASNAEGGDAFGTGLALNANGGNTLAVGAPGEASSATGVNGNQADNTALASGAAYVFVRTGLLWTQQAYVKASNAEAGDNFGRNLAVSGDTLVVGAVFEDSVATGLNGNQADNTAANSGAAYLFGRTGVAWAQLAYVKASNAETSDFFGFQTAASGDTVAVGAFLEDSIATGVNGNQADNTAAGSGAVYVIR